MAKNWNLVIKLSEIFFSIIYFCFSFFFSSLFNPTYPPFPPSVAPTQAFIVVIIFHSKHHYFQYNNFRVIVLRTK